MVRLLLAIAAIMGAVSRIGQAEDNLIAGGDFERGLEAWSEPWARSGSCKVQLVAGGRDGSGQAVRLEHDGKQDWSFPQRLRLRVAPGEIYELEGWLRLQGTGTAVLCVTLFDGRGEAIDWSYGGREVRAAEDWRQVRSRFIIPEGAAEMWPRLIGSGPVTVWFDDARLVRSGSLQELQAPGLVSSLSVENESIRVTFTTRDAALEVLDRRTGQSWRQRPAASVVVLDATPVERGFDVRFLDSVEMRSIRGRIRLDGDKPEITVELAAEGEMRAALAFPAPFVTRAGDVLIMPVNQGISYPVDDKSLGPMNYYLYGGHGLCMAWYGVTDGGRGMMTIVETPDDATVRVPQIEGLLCLAPEWQPQKQQFGPARRLRYVFFDDGGYVAMCKRYRQEARQNGLLVTLQEKKNRNSHVERLIGAVNVWCWSEEAVAMCREMQSLGIDKILWSNRARPEQIRDMNEMGVLSSRYDIYQDVMNPENFPRLRGVHPDWTTSAWPDDLMIDASGNWIRGWEVQSKDGERLPCGVLCDRQAPAYARQRTPAELETHPYLARFIDTTTASPWRECYDPRHPVTRTESKQFKMELLSVMSRECNLVTGCETGHEASVPFLHFFEGMMSLGPYRVPDSGRNMQRILDEVPERVAKFQTGHFYRLPLWELVYHDCTVSYWYWGDYNNKLPALWDRRDLWNALYGTPPMFMFNRQVWEQYRDRFVRSYQTATPVARATGYVEMVSHEWLTEDHAVQRTRFANGVAVTVNFGDKPARLDSGVTLGPLERHVEGL